MTESNKDVQAGTTKVVEKRIRPTVIRRRAKKVETPIVEEAPKPVEEKIQKIEAGDIRPKKLDGEAQEDGPRIGAVGQKIDLTKKEVEEEKVAKTAEPRIGVVGHIETVAPKLKEDWRDRFKRALRKKKSRSELEQDDIQKAGGLQKFADAMLSDSPQVERVFEPTRKKRPIRREFQKTKITTPKAIKKVIKIDERISVASFSQTMGIKASEIVKKLMGLGVQASINEAIDADTATLLAEEYGFKVEEVGFKEEDVLVEPEESSLAKNLQDRFPVVTVMGHVDHGKTSVLDYIRKTKVADGEAGGITQHIGAYEVKVADSQITFIDTPGHEAFTQMRARGAQATDIVVLVVAADDGVMPQTVEAINHSKAANVPIIVAINKSDLPGANADKVKQSVSEHGLVPEDWGGDVIFMPTSAKTGDGIDDLLEMITLQSEVLSLKADPTIRPKGIVLEGKLEKGRGPVATILVQEGTLTQGQFVVCGNYSGKVRAMNDAVGKNIKQAGPSKPVEIIGLEGVPSAGDELIGVEDDKDAKRIAEQRKQKAKEASQQKPVKLSLDDLIASETEELKVVLKSDVIGSSEAVCDSLEKLSTEKVKVVIIHKGVGTISENDVMLASASNAIILGFNVTIDKGGQESAKNEGIEVRKYKIIYEMLDDVKKAMVGLLTPIITETTTGSAEVKNTFRISKVGTIAGCMVANGKINRRSKIRLLRDQKIVYEGELSSLKRFKDDAKEVMEGQECGMSLERYQDIKVGDILEAYETQEEAAKL